MKKFAKWFDIGFVLSVVALATSWLWLPFGIMLCDGNPKVALATGAVLLFAVLPVCGFDARPHWVTKLKRRLFCWYCWYCGKCPNIR